MLDVVLLLQKDKAFFVMKVEMNPLATRLA